MDILDWILISIGEKFSRRRCKSPDPALLHIRANASAIRSEKSFVAKLVDLNASIAALNKDLPCVLSNCMAYVLLSILRRTHDAQIRFFRM